MVLGSRARIGAAVAVLSVVVAGCGKAAKPAAPTAADETRAVLTALRDIPNEGYTLGATTAPATLTGYMSLSDSWLQPLITADLPEIVARYVRRGRLAIQLRTISTAPATDATDDSVALARWALAAGLLDNKFWDALAVIGPRYVGSYQRDDREALAQALGIDLGTLRTAAASARVNGAIDRANALAKAAGARSGDFFLTRRGSTRVVRFHYAGARLLAADVARALR